MRVGLNLSPQNNSDWPRHMRGDWETAPLVPDSQIYDDEIAFASLAEPLGFDSLWTVEHHFTPHILSTSPIQFLLFFAGRTKRIDFGTQVIVLPWNDPVRIAEQIATMDNLLQGRKFSAGFGRGTARIEYEGYRVPRAESRERFDETLEIVRKALSRPHFSHQGKHFQIPEIGLRPMPRSTDLLDRMYMSWGSPDSVPVAAAAGLKPLIVPQKDWARHQEEIEHFNALRMQAGLKPERGHAMIFVYLGETETEAAEGQQYIEQSLFGVRQHYELENVDQFKGVAGYEWRARQAELVQRMTPAELADYRAKNQPGHLHGTPAQVLPQLKAMVHAVGAGELTVTMKFGQMPLAKAEKSLRLFAKEILPALHAMPMPEPRVKQPA